MYPFNGFNFLQKKEIPKDKWCPSDCNKCSIQSCRLSKFCFNLFPLILLWVLSIVLCLVMTLCNSPLLCSHSAAQCCSVCSCCSSFAVLYVVVVVVLLFYYSSGCCSCSRSTVLLQPSTPLPRRRCLLCPPYHSQQWSGIFCSRGAAFGWQGPIILLAIWLFL